MAIGQNEARKKSLKGENEFVRMKYLERRKLEKKVGRSYPGMLFNENVHMTGRPASFVQHVRIKKDNKGFYADSTSSNPRHFQTEAELKAYYNRKFHQTMKYHKRY